MDRIRAASVGYLADELARQTASDYDVSRLGQLASENLIGKSTAELDVGKAFQSPSIIDAYANRTADATWAIPASVADAMLLNQPGEVFVNAATQAQAKIDGDIEAIVRGLNPAALEAYAAFETKGVERAVSALGLGTDEARIHADIVPSAISNLHRGLSAAQLAIHAGAVSAEWASLEKLHQDLGRLSFSAYAASTRAWDSYLGTSKAIDQALSAGDYAGLNADFANSLVASLDNYAGLLKNSGWASSSAYDAIRSAADQVQASARSDTHPAIADRDDSADHFELQEVTQHTAIPLVELELGVLAFLEEQAMAILRRIVKRLSFVGAAFSEGDKWCDAAHILVSNVIAYCPERAVALVVHSSRISQLLQLLKAARGSVCNGLTEVVAIEDVNMAIDVLFCFIAELEAIEASLQ